jgi:mono/diheme cytochrome c family protein
MKFKPKAVLPAAILAVALPLFIAHAGLPDEAPAASTTIAATAPNNLPGWTVPTPPNPSDPIIARGEYLTVAGDCLPCHSVEGQPAFSGGLAVGSPVGAVFSPNITPSKKYGIGNYTDQQFWNVLHNGIAPGSSLLIFPKYLYPSMPYDAYSKLSYSDVMAIKAYLMSLPPAEIPNRGTQIPFPLNTRAALLGWRILFFHPQPVQYDAGWSPQIRNGAFLVQALGHCSDCHTPRNLLFASENSKFLAGGHLLSQSWYAPNISSDQTSGIGGWQPADLAAYLGEGGNIQHGAAFGPMQEVVNDSLSRLPASDVQDIVAYLQSGTAPQSNPQPAPAADVSEGAAVYADNCARCHGANGEGVSNNFPNLAGNPAIVDGPADDLASMVLGGFGPWHNAQSAMPAFANLPDEQIAAVANYIRTSWGNHGSGDTTAAQIGALRASVAVPVTLDTATVQATITSNGTAQPADDISGSFSIDGDHKNCQLDAHFGATALAGTCDGARLRGYLTMNGQTTPVFVPLYVEKSAVIVEGKLGSTGASINAHIALVTPND